MGMSAIRNLVNRDAPEIVNSHSLIPQEPEEIIPYIGIISAQYSIHPYNHMPVITHKSLFIDGPAVQDYWLGATIRGEAGRIRKGLDHTGDFAVTAVGLAVGSTVYDSLFDLQGHNSSTGIFFDETELINHKSSLHLKGLLAKAIFNILNPNETNQETTYMDVFWDSFHEHRDAESL